MASFSFAPRKPSRRALRFCSKSTYESPCTPMSSAHSRVWTTGCWPCWWSADSDSWRCAWFATCVCLSVRALIRLWQTDGMIILLSGVGSGSKEEVSFASFSPRFWLQLLVCADSRAAGGWSRNTGWLYDHATGVMHAHSARNAVLTAFLKIALNRKQTLPWAVGVFVNRRQLDPHTRKAGGYLTPMPGSSKKVLK